MNNRLQQVAKQVLSHRLQWKGFYTSQLVRQSTETPSAEYNIFHMQKELANTTTNLNATRQEARFLRASDQSFDGEFTLTTKTPAQSRVEVVLPFSTDIKLRESYMNFYNGIRIGLLLEGFVF